MTDTDRKTRRRRGPDEPLTRERIVSAALDVIDREGLEKLSMRRLGKELDVDPMAVYYHVPNKSALYDAIMDEVVGGLAELKVPRDVPFEEFLVQAGFAYREVLLRHVRALPLVTTRPMRTEHTLAAIEMLLERFLGLGLSSQEAIAAVDMFGQYVNGATTAFAQHELDTEYHEDTPVTDVAPQLDPERFPNLLRTFSEAEFVGFEAEFEFALRAMALGLEATARR